MTTADLLRDLKRPWKHGEHVDASDLTLEEPLVLDGLTICGFNLSRSVLKNGFSARGTRFSGLAWLRDTQVVGKCDLSGAQFAMDLRADGLNGENLVLKHSTIKGVLSLAGCHLSSLSLNHALVMAHMTLEGANIAGVTNLLEAELLGGLWACGGTFGSLDIGPADISGRIKLST